MAAPLGALISAGPHWLSAAGTPGACLPRASPRPPTYLEPILPHGDLVPAPHPHFASGQDGGLHPAPPWLPRSSALPWATPSPHVWISSPLCPGLRLTTHKGVGLTQNEVSTSKPRDPSVLPRPALEAIQRQRTRAQKPSCPSRSTARGARVLGTVPETSSLGEGSGSSVHGAPGCTRQPGGPAGQPRCSARAVLLFGPSRWIRAGLSAGTTCLSRTHPSPSRCAKLSPAGPKLAVGGETGSPSRSTRCVLLRQPRCSRPVSTAAPWPP